MTHDDLRALAMALKNHLGLGKTKQLIQKVSGCAQISYIKQSELETVAVAIRAELDKQKVRNFKVLKRGAGLFEISDGGDKLIISEEEFAQLADTYNTLIHKG